MASAVILGEECSALKSGNRTEIKRLYDCLFDSLLRKTNNNIKFLSDIELVKRVNERKGVSCATTLAFATISG